MVILFSHKKGGVGKSTMAINVAITLQEMKYKIHVLDADGMKTATQINQVRIRNKKKSPLPISNLKNSKDLKTFIDKNTEKLIIIDSGGFDSSMNRVALVMSDVIITPVSDRFVELLGLIEFKKIISQLEKIMGKKIKINVLLNNVNPRKIRLEYLRDFVKKSNDFSMFDTVVTTKIDYNKAMARGMSVLEYDRENRKKGEKKSRPHKEIKSLCEEIIKKLKEKKDERN